jgi:uncharacterized membrane protein
MKIAGHPVHPLLIHFPTALLPMDFVLSVIDISTGNHVFSLAGLFCLLGGVAMGLAAMLTGAIDFFSIPKSDKKALATALYHGSLNGCIILIFALVAYREWKSYPMPYIQGTTMLIVKGILVAALFAGNYLGGKLIYQYHIGIIQNKTDGKNQE